MRYLFALLFLIGCGGALPEEVPPPDVVSVGDPFDCRLDDADACHCTIPEHSAEAIEEMGERCNYLRAVAARLY